jgi:hypothetical protein
MRIASWTIGILLGLTPVLWAQSVSTPLQTTSGTGFTSAPYSGRETTVTTHTLEDGSTTTQTAVQLIWRDAEGRTRREMIRHTAKGEEFRSIIITDPVGGFYLKWEVGNPEAKPVASIWPASKAQNVAGPSPSAPPQSVTDSSVTTSWGGLRREVLPAQEINGVYAEGTRTTRTIHLEGESSNRVIELTNELWISPELKIIVRHVQNDPRTGKTTTEVSDVVRSDPDPGLFQAPAGYVLVDHRQQKRP